MLKKISAIADQSRIWWISPLLCVFFSFFFYVCFHCSTVYFCYGWFEASTSFFPHRRTSKATSRAFINTADWRRNYSLAGAIISQSIWEKKKKQLKDTLLNRASYKSIQNMCLRQFFFSLTVPPMPCECCSSRRKFNMIYVLQLVRWLNCQLFTHFESMFD